MLYSDNLHNAYVEIWLFLDSKTIEDISSKLTLNFPSSVLSIKLLFNIEILMLGGGGVLNWSLLQAGLCDEVSIVMAATADGSMKTPTLFMAKEGISEDKPIGFSLKSVKVLEEDILWIRYAVNNVK